MINDKKNFQELKASQHHQSSNRRWWLYFNLHKILSKTIIGNKLFFPW